MLVNNNEKNTSNREHKQNNKLKHDSTCLKSTLKAMQQNESSLLSKNNESCLLNQISKCNDKTRVLIVTESFHPYTSGIARRFKEIIQRLVKRNFLIHIITGCKGCETWTTDSELSQYVTFSKLLSIEFKDKLDCALPFLLPQYGMYRDIKKFKPDVIHCVEITPATTFCGALAKTLSIPIVWSSHTNLDYYIPLYISSFMSPVSLNVYQQLRRTFLNISNFNMTVSTEFVKQLKENGIKNEIHVWKTGVDSESFSPSYRSQEMRERMFNGYYSPDKILLVSVGRLSPEKNFEFLLNILEKFPQTFLCIVGGGPYKESLEPLFPKNQSHFIGFLQGVELASAYASADFFVYASVSETFGQVYLEAMSSGIPVVAAEGKQMKEFHFVNGVHGYTWKPGDVDSAIHAMSNSIKNRNNLAKNCRSNALSHSWNAAAEQIAQVYTLFKTNNKSKQTLFSKAKTACVYFSSWLYLNILVLLFMVPFMNVSKPQNSTNNSTESNNIHKELKRPKQNFSKSFNRRKRVDIDANSDSIITRSINAISLMFHIKRRRLYLVVDYLKSLLNTDKQITHRKAINSSCKCDSYLSTQFKKISALIISIISLTAIYAFLIRIF